SIVITLILATFFHLLTVHFFPQILMIGAALRIKDNFGVEKNQILHNEPVNAESRKIVMPSPDLLYSGISFDVGQYPLHISAPVPANTYWSLSMYDYDTDNFFVIDDRDIPTRELLVVLVRPGDPVPDIKEAIIVKAPEDQGIILFRMLINDRNEIAKLQEYQKGITCALIK
ncbi:MAG: DUF1254 domain-containing protein, partial [Candidatus Dadabacteria bacterium]|nr:DUF1254 domain-containing protein [Candidatus Dadabacteria bacterium]